MKPLLKRSRIRVHVKELLHLVDGGVRGTKLVGCLPLWYARIYLLYVYNNRIISSSSVHNIYNNRIIEELSSCYTAFPNIALLQPASLILHLFVCLFVNFSAKLFQRQ